MAEILNALTLHQPWAYWLAAGVKTVENRSWAPPRWMIGKPVVIHAGKTYDAEGEAWIRRRFPHLVWPTSAHMRKAAILGVVELTAVIAERHSTSVITDPGVQTWAELVAAGKVTRSDFDWWVGECGWVCRNAVLFERPVADVRGFQKLWTVPADVAARVTAQFEAARTRRKEAAHV